MATNDAPQLELIIGGSERQKVWRELFEELIQPRALDQEKCDQLLARLKPHGTLRLVRNKDGHQ